VKICGKYHPFVFFVWFVEEKTGNRTRFVDLSTKRDGWIWKTETNIFRKDHQMASPVKKIMSKEKNIWKTNGSILSVKNKNASKKKKSVSRENPIAGF